MSWDRPHAVRAAKAVVVLAGGGGAQGNDITCSCNFFLYLPWPMRHARRQHSGATRAQENSGFARRGCHGFGPENFPARGIAAAEPSPWILALTFPQQLGTTLNLARASCSERRTGIHGFYIDSATKHVRGSDSVPGGYRRRIPS
eukprot:GEMP01041275.1.p1 GENE.GEMP01041275.1~~GEMP01041275.1.p1  ORF type:complete len:145 (-),score=15.48 GEMP01041275.1:523-957(-)